MVEPLPDSDHVLRYVRPRLLEKDEQGRPIGIAWQALELRDDEEELSVLWVEYYGDSATGIPCAIWAKRKAYNVARNSAFAHGNVGRIKQICSENAQAVRILHEPEPGEPCHSAIRRLPRDNQSLFELLARTAFERLILNSEVGEELP